MKDNFCHKMLCTDTRPPRHPHSHEGKSFRIVKRTINLLHSSSSFLNQSAQMMLQLLIYHIIRSMWRHQETIHSFSREKANIRIGTFLMIRVLNSSGVVTRRWRMAYCPVSWFAFKAFNDAVWLVSVEDTTTRNSFEMVYDSCWCSCFCPSLWLGDELLCSWVF